MVIITRRGKGFRFRRPASISIPTSHLTTATRRYLEPHDFPRRHPQLRRVRPTLHASLCPALTFITTTAPETRLGLPRVEVSLVPLGPLQVFQAEPRPPLMLRLAERSCSSRPQAPLPTLMLVLSPFAIPEAIRRRPETISSFRRQVHSRPDMRSRCHLFLPSKTF